MAAAGGGGRAREPDELRRDRGRGHADIASNALSVAFGDFGRGYLVVDRRA